MKTLIQHTTTRKPATRKASKRRLATYKPPKVGPLHLSAAGFNPRTIAMEALCEIFPTEFEKAWAFVEAKAKKSLKWLRKNPSLENPFAEKKVFVKFTMDGELLSAAIEDVQNYSAGRWDIFLLHDASGGIVGWQIVKEND